MSSCVVKHNNNNRFRATIVDDFYEKWFEITAMEQKVSVEDAKYLFGSKEITELAERISGKEVTIVKKEILKMTAYFEEKDMKVVINPELFIRK